MADLSLQRALQVHVHCARLGLREEDGSPEFIVAVTFPSASSPGSTSSIRTKTVSSGTDPVWNERITLFVVVFSSLSRLTWCCLSFISRINSTTGLGVQVVTVTVLQKQLVGTRTFGVAAVPVGDVTVVPRTEWYALAAPSRSPGTARTAPQPPNSPGTHHAAREIRLTLTSVLPRTAPQAPPPCAPWCLVPSPAQQTRRTLSPLALALAPNSFPVQQPVDVRARKEQKREEDDRADGAVFVVPETAGPDPCAGAGASAGKLRGPRFAAHFFVAGLPANIETLARAMRGDAASAWDAVALPLELLGAVPLADADAVPPDVGALLAPEGARLTSTPAPPAVNPVVTTDGAGHLHYITCLRVSERLPPRTAAAVSALARRTRVSGTTAPAPDTPLYFPKCYCIASRSPAALPLQRRWLSAFYYALVTGSGESANSVAARRMVCKLLLVGPEEEVTPVPRTIFDATLFGKPLARVCGTPITTTDMRGIALARVLTRLRPGVVAELFGALLLQASVLLVSDSLTRLTHTALALRALLHPLGWWFTFVPVCAAAQVPHLLDSPQPVLFGVTRATAAAFAGQLDALVCCDLDDALLVLPSRAVPAAAALPPREYSLLLRDLAWATSTLNTVEDEDDDEDENKETIARAPFLRFFLRTLADMPVFLDYVRVAGVHTPIVHLDRARFVAVHEQRTRAQTGCTSDALAVAAFLERLLGSQAVATLVDTFSVTRPTLFNRLLMSRRAATIAQTAPIADFVAEVQRVQHAMRTASSPTRIVHVDLTPSGVTTPPSSPSHESGSFGPFTGLLCPLQLQQQQQQEEEHDDDDDEDQDDDIVDLEFCDSAAEYVSARHHELQQMMHESDRRNEQFGMLKDIAARFWIAVIDSNREALPRLATTVEQLVARRTMRRYLAQSYVRVKQARGGHGAESLTQDAYAAVVRVFKHAFRAASEQEDYVTPCALVDLLQEFQYSTSHRGEALSDQLKGTPLLSKNALWENYFYAAADRALRGPAVYGTTDSLAAAVLRRFRAQHASQKVQQQEEEEQQEEDSINAEKELNALFGVLGEMVCQMSKVSVPLRVIKSVTLYLSGSVRLPRERQTELQTLIATLSKVELATVLSIPADPDGGRGPGAYAADTWAMMRNIRHANGSARTPSAATTRDLDTVLLQSSTIGFCPGSGTDDDDGCDSPVIQCFAAARLDVRAPGTAPPTFLSPVLQRRADAATALIGVALPPLLERRSADDATRHRATVLRGHTAPVLCLASCGADRLVSAGCDNALCVWALRPAHPAPPTAILRPHSGWVSCLHVCNSAKVLAGAYDATVSVNDLATGQTVATLRGHQGPLTCLTAPPNSSDGSVALSGAADATAVLWDLRTARASLILDDHRGAVTCTAWLDANTFVTGCGDSVVRLWDLRQRCLLAELHGHCGSVTSLAVASSSSSSSSSGSGGAQLFSSSTDGTVIAWDTAQGSTQPRRCCVQAHSGPVHALAYSPVHRCIASGGADGAVRVWDPAALRLQHDLPGHAGDVTALAPFRHYFASSGADHTTRLWNPKAGSSALGTSPSASRSRKGTAARVAPAPAKPAGETAAVGGGRDRAHATTADAAEDQCLREACNVHCRHIFAGHSAAISALCTIGDKIVATAGWDATVQFAVWS